MKIRLTNPILLLLIYFSDDIPIQAGDESLNQSALLSISEETEASESQLGTRNNLVRSSKEILKTHKVAFSGFKKLKDKEKDKDSGGNANVISKNQLSKNGSLLNMDGMKESVIVAATKQLTRKDKKNSLQMSSVDASEVSAYADKASPLLQIKRKSSSIDLINNGPSLDLVQMQSFTNGNSIIIEEKKTIDANVDDIVAGAEKSPDVIIQQQQRTSLIVDQNGKTSTTHSNTQISQV